MAHAWLRLYHEVLDDPKVQKLDPVTFKHWINLLCLACRHGGKLPANPETAFALRIDEIALESVLDRLLIATLIEVRKGGPNGSYIAPHGWQERQYKSDTSTERVKRFRQRSKTVTETAPDTETELSFSTDVEKAASGDAGKQFWDSAKAYFGGSKASLIGKLAGEYGREAVATAITAAMLTTPQPPDRVSYVIGILKRNHAGSDEFTGFA